jgi:hypothetical protein
MLKYLNNRATFTLIQQQLNDRLDQKDCLEGDLLTIHKQGKDRAKKDNCRPMKSHMLCDLSNEANYQQLYYMAYESEPVM